MRASSRIGGPGKAAQTPEEGNGRERERERERMGEAGRARSAPEVHSIQVIAPNVRKNAAHKESSRENSHVQGQRLMAGPNCQAGWGKDGAAQTLGQPWLLYKGEV
jgi:hypothetical protein